MIKLVKREREIVYEKVVCLGLFNRWNCCKCECCTTCGWNVGAWWCYVRNTKCDIGWCNGWTQCGQGAQCNTSRDCENISTTNGCGAQCNIATKNRICGTCGNNTKGYKFWDQDCWRNEKYRGERSVSGKIFRLYGCVLYVGKHQRWPLYVQRSQCRIRRSFGGN